MFVFRMFFSLLNIANLTPADHLSNILTSTSSLEIPFLRQNSVSTMGDPIPTELTTVFKLMFHDEVQTDLFDEEDVYLSSIPRRLHVQLCFGLEGSTVPNNISKIEYPSP